jgi:hypothetical protein
MKATRRSWDVQCLCSDSVLHRGCDLVVLRVAASGSANPATPLRTVVRGQCGMQYGFGVDAAAADMAGPIATSFSTVVCQRRVQVVGPAVGRYVSAL